MEDSQIIALYWERSEDAISETATKYGSFCHAISYNILSNHEDAGECVNDTYLSAWKLIPPTRPAFLAAFLGKITRHISIDRWRRSSARKRGGGEMVLALEELEECIPDTRDMEKEMEERELEALIRRFLQSISGNDRTIFLKRYWLMASIPEIAAEMRFSVPKVKSSLHRTRKKLHQFLEEENYARN